MLGLSSEASGLRHLRWAREVLASVEAHGEHNPRLSAGDREALLEEAAGLRELVQKLSGAVKPYRDFLERTRVEFRGRQRVGSFLCEQARRDLAARLDAAGAETERALVSRIDPEVSPLESPASPLVRYQRSALLAERTAALLRSLPPESAPLSTELAGELERASAILRAHNDAFIRMEEEQRRPLKRALRAAIADLRGGLEGMNERISQRLGDAFVEGLYPELARSGSMVADEDDEDDDASAPLDPEAAG